ncbi:MAG TPA: hypothetical protein ENF95_02075, partial [Candidatus Aenigmarchaeota archaeon]|nr:hypothetical protein [Candidatus Aenigmarchaeota archaeon]
LKRLFEGRGLPYRTLEHYSSKQTKKELKDFEKKVDRLWNLMLRDVSFRREAGFDRIGPVFYYYFRGRKRILEVVMYASLLESFLRAEKPRVVILPEDTSELGKISVKVSKKFSIPVLTVQHGLISESFPYRGRGESDVYAVWGPEFKKVMNKWGIPKKKIKVVGCPLYDVVKVKKSLKFYKKFGLDPSVKTMVFASQRIPERKKALEVLAEFVAKVKNVQLIDKLHPVESYRADLNEHLRYFKGKERVAIIRNEEKRMIELWPYCDILIGVDSTVLLEGMVMGKPVIVLNPAGRKLSLPYTKYGAIEVKNVRELMNVVKAILSGKDIMKKMEAGRKKLIKEYFYKMDGKASERIAGIIEELMGAS